MSDEDCDSQIKLKNEILNLLQDFEFQYEDGPLSEDGHSMHSSSTVTAEAEQAEACNEEGATNENEDLSIASQETVENCSIRRTNRNEDCSTASQETVENSSNQDEDESTKVRDAERERLLALLEGNDEIEERLMQLHQDTQDEVKKKEITPNQASKASTTEDSTRKQLIVDTPVLHPQVDTLIDLTDEQKVVTIKIEPVEKVIIIEDDNDGLNVREEKVDAVASNKSNNQNKPRRPITETSSSEPQKKEKTFKKDEKPVTIEDKPPKIKVEKCDIKQEPSSDVVVVKREKQDDIVSSTSDIAQTVQFPERETEEGEVLDDEIEIPLNNVKIKQEPMALVKPELLNKVAAAMPSAAGLPPQALYTTILTELNISMAKSLDKLTRYVTKHQSKKKSHRRKSKKKHKSRRHRNYSSSSGSTRSRSSSRSRSRSRSRSDKNKSKKTILPKQYRASSPQSTFREKELTIKRNYRSNKRARSSSRSVSKSPDREVFYSKPRRISRTPSPLNTKALVVKKEPGARSPRASPPRRKRKRSSPSSSATDSSSSSPRYKRRWRSRTRSRSPKRSDPLPTAVPSEAISSLPSTSTFVQQQTYQQTYLQGNNVMTRHAIVTTSYKEELQSFKKTVKTAADTSNNNKLKNMCELNKLEITVFDEDGKDVTIKRPDGDLNHPFYIHPEDAELYQMKCKNGLQPLQALHEICVKCGWRLPNYLLLPTPKGFRFGMEINEHRFVTEKTAPQKKLAKAAAALRVLQWLRIVDVILDE